VDNKCLKLVNHFKYIGFEISFKSERDIEQKPGKFAQILGIRNKNCKQTLVQKLSTTNVHNALAVHILLYGSEIWTIRKKIKKKMGIDRDEI